MADAEKDWQRYERQLATLQAFAAEKREILVQLRNDCPHEGTVHASGNYPGEWWQCGDCGAYLGKDF